MNCGHTADEHAAIIRNKVGLLPTADRVNIMLTAQSLVEGRLETELWQTDASA